MNSERARQILAYRRAQGYAGANTEPDQSAGAKEVVVPEGPRQPTISRSFQLEAGVTVAPPAPPPSVALLPVDHHWLQVKIRQLNVPALRVLLAQLPAPLQRLLLPQLDKSVAAELLKRARPSQRRELLRVGREPDEKLFAELESHYRNLFAAETPRGGRRCLEEICRYLPSEHRQRLGRTGGGWQDSPSLKRMVRRLRPEERALLLGHPDLGHTVLGMLSPEEKLSCLREVIRLAEMPASLRRRRLRRLLSRGVSVSGVTSEAERRRVGV